ncbi:MAG TPA: RecX family transcriptional regulator [Gaiellaceae bacterium]
MPDDVVVRCELRTGVELDRPLARSLARELRQAKALGTAARALRGRPLSEERLRQRLRMRGIPENVGDAAVGMLSAAGYVDDARLARGRASALAERGWGDGAILTRLAAEGLPQAEVAAAVAELEAEAVRAAPLAFGTDRRKAWSLLQRRGFDMETIETVLGQLDETGPDGLG